MIGIVADDITGANDIGIMYAKAGLRTTSTAWRPGVRTRRRRTGRRAVIDTNSRLDGAAEDIGKRRLRRACFGRPDANGSSTSCSASGAISGRNSTPCWTRSAPRSPSSCSGFRKQAGPRPAGCITRTASCSRNRSSPARSRASDDGIEPRVHSAKADGAPRRARADRVVEQGPDALRAEIDRMRPLCAYLIVDVRDQDPPRIIAEAARDESILCGSSALSEESGAAGGGARRRDD